MPNMELIGGPTGGQISSPAASITFSNIPQTYTDLKLVISARNNDTNGAGNIMMGFNGSTSSFTNKFIQGGGSGTAGSSSVAQMIGDMDTAAETASTFNNIEVYIPNYRSSNYKSFISDSVMENNATTAYQMLTANLWSNVSPITSIEITNRSAGKSFVSGSTFYLYGISNVTSTTKATGGIVSSDGTYNYHMFPFSGTFTPTESITADVLVIAGGGGGGSFGGGGGAGGFRAFTSQSLSSGIAYTATVGAGASGGASNGKGSNGGNSSFSGSGFSTVTSSGGGGGGGYTIDPSTGGSGGGGGTQGGGTRLGAAGNSGAYTPVEGYAGGDSYTASAPYSAGGGGGASAAGSNGTSSTPSGGGGSGSNSYSSWAAATGTGVGGYYAGGGGGFNGGVAGAGGAGTGATGGGSSATVNTGSGGGAGGNSAGGGAGGSGIVIIRYAV